MHLSRATAKARKLAASDDDFLAVVHCGTGEYTVKRDAVAAKYYPRAVRRVLTPNGTIIENKNFSREAW